MSIYVDIIQFYKDPVEADISPFRQEPYRGQAAVLDVVHGSPPQPWRDVESEEEYRKDIQIPDSARHEPDISPNVTCT